MKTLIAYASVPLTIVLLLFVVIWALTGPGAFPNNEIGSLALSGFGVAISLASAGLAGWSAKNPHERSGWSLLALGAAVLAATMLLVGSGVL